MFSDFEVYRRAQEPYQAMLREAEQQRLIRRALAGSRPVKAMRSRVLLAVGDRLVSFGEYLRATAAQPANEITRQNQQVDGINV
jgi:hypothetical protein